MITPRNALSRHFFVRNTYNTSSWSSLAANNQHGNGNSKLLATDDWIYYEKQSGPLWISADDDLLSTSASTYHLFNTGQGLNRVKDVRKLERL